MLGVVLVAAVLGGMADEAGRGTTSEDVRFEVAAEPRAAAVGEEVVVTIRVENRGSAPAREIAIAVTSSGNLKPTETAGTEESAWIDVEANRLVFPPIGALAPGEERTVKIKAKASETGIATCQVTVTDASLGGVVLRKDGHLRIIPGEPPLRTGSAPTRPPAR